MAKAQHRVPPVDVIDMLLKIGMNRSTAEMAIPFMFIAPAASDPYSPVIIMLVEAIQHTLAKAGWQTRQDGFIDKSTSAAIKAVAGSSWKSMPWYQVVGSMGAGGSALVPRHRRKVLPMGFFEATGAVPSGWCSDKNPQAGCSPVRNVCKPMDAHTLGVFKAMQKQINRVAAKKGFARIAIDGRPGSKTVAAFNKSVAAAKKRGAPSSALSTLNAVNHCDHLAMAAEVVTPALKSFANKLRAPAQVPAPPATAPPSVALPGGGVRNPPNSMISEAGITAFVTSPLGMGVIAAGVLGLLLAKKRFL